MRDTDRDALTASLDYSANDGATWRTIAGGIRRDRFSLPSRLLTASARARLRVRVSDGLNETVAMSGRFTSGGAGPVVAITTPEGRVTIGANEPLHLQAQAYDDAFRPLRGRSVTWFDGRRRVAAGTGPSVGPLAPGLHRIKVVARDRLARRATDSVAVRVVGVVPRVIVRGVPARLADRATLLRIRVGTTVPSMLAVSGPGVRGKPAGWKVGARLLAISIPVKPSSRPTRLRLTATAHGKSSSLALTVRR
jgi:hypothetical protein